MQLNKRRSSPLSGYYGGKERLSEYIAKLIEATGYHYYVEPFAGAASVFFQLHHNDKHGYCINDLNDNIVNFYFTAKDKPAELTDAINKRGLYCRRFYDEASAIYAGDVVADDVQRAWATWYKINGAYGGNLDNQFAHGYKRIQKAKRKRLKLARQLAILEHCIVESVPALTIIKRYNNKTDTVMYIDPPYVNAYQGHYGGVGGYTQADFNALLALLSETRARFVLSHYPNDEMEALAAAKNWTVERHAARNGESTPRTEILIYNFAARSSLML